MLGKKRAALIHLSPRIKPIHTSRVFQRDIINYRQKLKKRCSRKILSIIEEQHLNCLAQLEEELERPKED